MSGSIRLLAAAGLVLTLTAGTFADVLVMDDFDYDISVDASLSGKGGVADGWAGGWSASSGQIVDVSLAPLAAAGVSGGGQALRSSNLNSNSFASRAIAASAGISNDKTIWLSYLIRWESGTKNNGERVHLYDTQTNWDHRYFGVSPQSTDDDYVLSRSYNTRDHGGGEFGVGDTALLVMKLTSDGEDWVAHDVWVNPTSEPTVGRGDIFYDTPNGEGWSTLPGLGFTHRASNDTFLFDRIRVGEEFKDVAVPEPASLALLAIGGAMLLRRRV